MREMAPTASIMPPPKVDFFGNDIKVPGFEQPSTMFANRLLNPFVEMAALEGKQSDVIKMLIKYNSTKKLDDKNDPPVWFQEPSRKVSVRYPNNPASIREDMNEKEYHLYAKLSGLLAAKEIDKINWNFDKPSSDDIMLLEKIFTKTREASRKMITAARQAKALNYLDEYDRIIREVEDEIKKSVPAKGAK